MCINEINRKPVNVVPVDTSRALDKIHIDYLTNQDTLKGWVGLSLDERAATFQNNFPDKKLTGGRLRHIYVKQRIKYKLIRAIKRAPVHRAHLIP